LLLVQAHVLLANILRQDLLYAQIALQALFLLLRVQDLVHLAQLAALTKQQLVRQVVQRALHVAQLLVMERLLQLVLQQQTQYVVLQLHLLLLAQHLQNRVLLLPL